ncbi:non-claret disjunctional [Carabus blaptoides fortunei]
MGIIPRPIDLIFQLFLPLEQLDWQYSVKASFLEIYNKNLVDLLWPKKGDHEIKMRDAKGTDSFMKIAQQNRSVTAMVNNERSSRSHSIAKIQLEAVNEEGKECCASSLNLVDLTGSERVDSSGTDGN